MDRNLNPNQRNIKKIVVAENENHVINQGTGGIASNFIAVLNAKLTSSGNSTSSANNSTTNSPKPMRKFSIDQQTNRNPKTSNDFLETLNARLAEQQQQQNQHQQQQQQNTHYHQQQRVIQSNISLRSASVRRIMANRIPIIDPHQVRDSLMDQIRRGTSLRKTTGPINDRSAPKIF